MLSKEEIENILNTNEDIITYKADKDYRCLTSTEKSLLENNRKIKEYIEQLETKNQKLIEKLELEIETDEEDLKYNNLSDYGRGCLDEAKETLEILKGENDE